MALRDGGSEGCDPTNFSTAPHAFPNRIDKLRPNRGFEVLMNILGCVVAISIFLALNATAEEARPNLLHREALRQLITEHVDCAMYYLASSVCSKSGSAFATQSRGASEIMMQRAYQLAAEAKSTQQAVTLHGKIMLDEINKQIDGDCNKLVLLDEKYKMCKGLAEDFTVRGREILQKEIEEIGK